MKPDDKHPPRLTVQFKEIVSDRRFPTTRKEMPICITWEENTGSLTSGGHVLQYLSEEEHAAIVSELVRAARVSAFNEAANYAEHYWGDTVVNGLREMAKKARAAEVKK